MKKTLQYIAVLAFALTAIYACTQKGGGSNMPAPGDTPAVNIESPNVLKLENGLTVLVVENHHLPRVNILLLTDAPAQPEGEKAGTQFLLTRMLGTATTEMKKEDFNEKLDFMGATLAVNNEGITASGLSRFFPEILQLMAGAVLRPKFDPAEFELARGMKIEELRSQEKDVSTVTKKVFNALTFGAKSAYGEFETEQTLGNIRLQDIQTAYKETFVPNNAYLTIVGDVKFDEVKTLVEENFGSWKKGEESIAPADKAENPEAVEINIVDIPSAVQATITIGNVHDIRMNSAEYFAADLSNAILGGNSINSRLNSNLREKNGFTYGANSQISYDKYQPSFSAAASVSNRLVARAIKEFMVEFNRISVITQEDLDLAKARMKGEFMLAMENPATIAAMGVNLLIEDLPRDFYANYLKSIDKLTVADVQKIVPAYLKANNLRILVVGNASEFRKDINKSGYAVKYFDTQGNRIR